MINLHCPKCGSSISLDEKREYGFCLYCGEKIEIPSINKSKTKSNDFKFQKSDIENSGISDAIQKGFNSISDGDILKADSIFQDLFIQNPDNIYAVIGKVFSSGLDSSNYYNKLKAYSNDITKEEKDIINSSNASIFAKVYCHYDDKERITYILNNFPHAITLDLLTEKACFNKNINMAELFINASLPTTDIFNAFFSLAYKTNKLYSTFYAQFFTLNTLSQLLAAGMDFNKSNINFKKYSEVDGFISLKDAQITLNEFFSKYFTESYEFNGDSTGNEFYRYYGYSYFLDSSQRNSTFATPKEYLMLLNNYKIKEKYQSNPEYLCYMGTCLYGSYNCPEVWVLRRFRDKWLYDNPYHIPIINTYYHFAPKIVNKFDTYNWFKVIVKSALDKFIQFLKKRNYDDTPYSDMF